MKVAVELDLDDRQVFNLVAHAYVYGWAREDTKKRWTNKEKNAAARYALEHLSSSLPELP